MTLESKIIFGLLLSTIGSAIFILISKMIESYAKNATGSQVLGMLIFVTVIMSFYIYLIFYWLDLYQESLQ